MVKSVVITGASGHLGSHVAWAALEQGLNVNLLTRGSNANIERLRQAGARVQAIDFSDPAQLLSAFEQAEILFHVAGVNTLKTDNPQDVLRSTAGLAESVLHAAVKAQVPQVVYTSSVVVLGRSRDPSQLLDERHRTSSFESPYVQGKAQGESLCEQLIAEHGIDIRRLYPSWLVGPGALHQTPPQRFIGDFLRKGQLFWFDGGVSIADVREVGRAHVAAALHGERNGAYVLGGDNITFHQFFTLLAQLTGRRGPRFKLPKSLMVAGATVLDWALRLVKKRSPIDPAYVRSVVGTYSWYDSSKAIKELNYRIPAATATLAEGILAERKRAAGTDALFEKPRLPIFPGPRSIKTPPLVLTGAPGWLGNRFIDILLNGDRNGRFYPNREVRLLVEPRQAALFDLPDRFRIFPVDLTQPASLGEAVQGASAVFHLAGAVYPNRIRTLYAVNTEGTRKLVDACIEEGVRRFLYMSTDSVCGHGSHTQRVFDEHTADSPYRHYGRSKWLAEQYIRDKTSAGQLDGTILRGFWFFGPFAPARQQNFLAMMRKNRQLVFGSGKNFRSISHTDNTVAAFLAAENAPQTIGKTYWIGDEKADYTVDDVYRILCEASGQTYRPLYIPSLACQVARVVDSAMGRFGLLHPTIHALGKFDFDVAGHIEAAKRDFGYQPLVSLSECAHELVANGKLRELVVTDRSHELVVTGRSKAIGPA